MSDRGDVGAASGARKRRGTTKDGDGGAGRKLRPRATRTAAGSAAGGKIWHLDQPSGDLTRMCELEQPADGNCLYHAVRVGIGLIGHSRANFIKNSTALRRVTEDWLRSDGAGAVRLHSGSTLEEHLSESGMTVLGVADRTRKRGKAGWGGIPETVALAHALSINIEVWQGDTRRPGVLTPVMTASPSDAAALGTVRLRFLEYEDNVGRVVGHYQLLTPEKSVAPPTPRRACSFE